MSILSKIKGLFVRAELSVDHVIADIIGKIEHLHVIEDAKRLEADAHAKLANEYDAMSEAAHNEADRAKAIAEKMSALVS